MKALASALAAFLAAGLITACGGRAPAASQPPAVSSPSGTPPAVAAQSPCAASVSAWEVISLPYEPAPASPLNSLSASMLRLRSATREDDGPLISKLGGRIARDAQAVLNRGMPPACAPGLRHAVRKQMVFAKLAGARMQFGSFSSAAAAMKRAAAWQDKVMADEDRITGSDMGGW